MNTFEFEFDCGIDRMPSYLMRMIIVCSSEMIFDILYPRVYPLARLQFTNPDVLQT